MIFSSITLRSQIWQCSAVLTGLTAPGRGGLPGAAERAASWAAGPPLRDLADRAGIRFGSPAMVRDMRRDPQYSALLAREFNTLTPFVEMKWGTIHPERDRYDFGPADELVEFAVRHRMRVRGHALVYGQVVDPPNTEYLSRTTDPAALGALVADHVRTVVGRYAGRVTAWDVVNEPLAWRLDSASGGLDQHVFSRTLREKGLSFTVEYAYPLPTHIRTDPTRLKQILLNLCANAIKFTHQGGVRLELAYEPPSQRLRLSIVDSGIGINTEQQAKLFQPFSQADIQTARKFGGTGLGRAITRQYCEMMGGGIKVKSVRQRHCIHRKASHHNTSSQGCCNFCGSNR